MTKKDSSETEKESTKPIFESLRKIMLASIGVVALAQDEIEDFIYKLIDRGEIAEKDGRNLIADLRKKRAQKFEERGSEFEKHMRKIVDRMGVPTRSEIQDLNDKISMLTKQIEELNKKEEK
ncbi:MAG: phasin family protein [Anaerolineales bacterium]|nr:phasin family protein [Anaerolineales bacterium]